MPPGTSPLLLPDKFEKRIASGPKGDFLARKYVQKQNLTLRNNAAYLILAGTPLPTSNRHASENQGVTVIVSADEWLAPEVAVTVILKLPCGVPVVVVVCV
jgi:hypothetical protein